MRENQEKISTRSLTEQRFYSAKSVSCWWSRMEDINATCLLHHRRRAAADRRPTAIEDNPSAAGRRERERASERERKRLLHCVTFSKSDGIIGPELELETLQVAVQDEIRLEPRAWTATASTTNPTMPGCWGRAAVILFLNIFKVFGQINIIFLHFNVFLNYCVLLISIFPSWTFCVWLQLRSLEIKVSTRAEHGGVRGLQLHFAVMWRARWAALTTVTTRKNITGLQSSAVLFLCRNAAYNFTHTHTKENHLQSGSHTVNRGKFLKCLRAHLEQVFSVRAAVWSHRWTGFFFFAQ